MIQNSPHAPRSRLSCRRGRFPRIALAALIGAGLTWGALDLRSSAAEGLPEWPPGGNIRVLDAWPVPPETAEDIYQSLLARMKTSYARSGLDSVDYAHWRRLTAQPVISERHGNRFVNLYVNERAMGLATVTGQSPMPAGAVVALDSFSVIHSGATSPGPLFLMEKMAAGFWPEAGDWRFTLIMPNGYVFGTSKGKGNAAVQFCADCHAQAADTDHLFALPGARAGEP